MSIAKTENTRLADAIWTLEGGVDSGRNPSLIRKNQVAWAVNTTFRGGYARPRPGYTFKHLTFENTDTQGNFQDNLFQGAYPYTPRSGPPALIASIGGRIFRVLIIDSPVGYSVMDMSIATDLNSPTVPHAWFTQAEDFLIVQNGQSRPLAYDGANVRRLGPGELPSGTVMAYSMGRVWVAAQDGLSFVAGDIVYGPTGTPAYNYRDGVLKFTENTFLNEGGSFAVPVNGGPITAMRPIPTLDTSLGQGPLQVFTQTLGFSVNAPTDRTTWKDVTYPIQTVSLIDNGPTSQSSLVMINSDGWYRSSDGWRSFVIARRDFQSPGNTPMSDEMNRVLRNDDKTKLSYASAILFDNRLIGTCIPQFSNGHGVYHLGLAVLQFESVSSIGQKSPPIWEGQWTGLKILQVLTLKVNFVDRAFAFVLNIDDEIELWEITPEAKFDRLDGLTDTRINWMLETPRFGFPRAGSSTRFFQKQLEGADMWLEQLTGEVSATVRYKPDGAHCWFNWANWSRCATYQKCLPVCSEMFFPSPQYRPRKMLPQPPDDCEPGTSRPSRRLYEVQNRIDFQGYAVLTGFRVTASDVIEEANGEECNESETCISTGCCNPTDIL